MKTTRSVKLIDAVSEELFNAWGVPPGSYVTTLTIEDGCYVARSHRITDTTRLARFACHADDERCAWQLWHRLTGRALSMAELRGEE